MLIFKWEKTLYGNGDSSFPYGDVAQTRAGKSQSLSQNLGDDALQRVTWRSPNEHTPFPYGDSPYGNGQGDLDIPIWGIPVSEQSLFPFGD